MVDIMDAYRSLNISIGTENKKSRNFKICS